MRHDKSHGRSTLAANPAEEGNRMTDSLSDPDVIPDHCGGATLTDLAGRVRVAHGHLRALDVARSPDLVGLDLAHCPPGLHLTLQDCARLEWIRLPAGDTGATVHLDAGDGRPELLVLGAVERLDCCWSGGTFEVQAPRHARPLNGVAIQPSPPDCPVEGWVALSPSLPRSWTVPPALRQVWLHRPQGLVDVHVEASGRLDHLVATDAEALARLRLARTGVRVQLRTCPGLSEAYNEDGVLHMTDCGHRGAILHAKGGWRRLTFQRCSFFDVHAETVEVVIQRSPRVNHLHVPGGVHAITTHGHFPVLNGALGWYGSEANGVRQLLGTHRDRDDALSTLYGWTWLERTRAQRLSALRALEEALDEHDPELLWRLRCLLHLRVRSQPKRPPDMDEALRVAGNRWHWDFNSDLWLEGRASDLALYRAVADQPVGEGFGRLLHCPGDPHTLHGLAWTLRRWHGRGDDWPDDWTQAIDKGLRRITRRGYMNRAIHDAVQAVLQLAVRLRDRALADLIFAFARDRLTPEHGAPLFITLAQHGYAPARPRLMVVSRKLNWLQEDLRQQAAAAAIARVRTHAFSIDTETPQEASI
ncbi:hypothetical protein Mlg_1547 [Alkalilimnicola ehrlichii MLHE-1]|uniref:Uncharacterized protein n=2 Tax=Alkalilimnicola ehrlichii TaxID=351052 RepID=Q0A8E3_ALKEH|nr:hypothetical protein Mlg_1547 [Alkalilimnicola ehrlichii MLHE-1]